MLYQRILSYVLRTPWGLHPDTMREYLSLLAFRSSGQRLSDEEITARIRAGQERAAARGAGARVGAVAVMPIIGTFLSRSSAMQDISGASSTQSTMAAFQSLVADDAVGAVVLDLDSPGGEVGGIEEFADAIYEARAVKPIIALANPQCASAAYYIAAAASELLVVPSGEIGSVGVWCAHEDLSKFLDDEGVKITLVSAGDHKTEGNPFEPLSDEARAYMQLRVDEYYDLFVKSVARGRGVSQAVVRDTFGGGRMVGAAQAVKLDMADGIGTLDDAIALATRRAKSAGARADITLPPVVADRVEPTTAETAPDDDLERRRRRLRLAER